MNKRIFHIFLFWSVALVFTACSDFQKILKSDSVDKKYEAALKYYDKKDYYKAGPARAGPGEIAGSRRDSSRTASPFSSRADK